MAVSFTDTSVANPSGAQGSYPLELVAGHEGMLADLQSYVSRSYVNQSGAAVPFGVLVATDNSPTSNDALAVEIATGTTLIAGIAISTAAQEGASAGQAYTPNPTPIYSDGRLGYANGKTMNVMSKGVCWVYTMEAVALGDSVRFYNAENSGVAADALLGRFGKTAVSSKTTEITSGARWLSETSGAGLALLELDIPGAAYSADA
ncbi:MAG: hypothetical protein EBV86_03370 [Marivivens sp.]|nr:hypothetical protein [Marivivens sp.]NCW67600.1 hypothetical protein [Marivivens sp.]